VAIAFPHRISDFLSASDAFLSALESFLSALESFLSVFAPLLRWIKFPERFLYGECAQASLQRAQEIADSVGKYDGHPLNADSKFAKIRRVSFEIRAPETSKGMQKTIYMWPAIHFAPGFLDGIFCHPLP
jgi:hypothetical protein